jgi:hypothetical protein
MKRTCSQSSFPPQFGRTCSISGNSGREILPSAGRSSRLCEHCALGSHIEARMPSSMKKPADEDPQPDRQTLKTGARRHLTVSPRFPVPIVGGTHLGMPFKYCGPISVWSRREPDPESNRRPTHPQEAPWLPAGGHS